MSLETSPHFSMHPTQPPCLCSFLAPACRSRLPSWRFLLQRNEAASEPLLVCLKSLTTIIASPTCMRATSWLSRLHQHTRNTPSSRRDEALASMVVFAVEDVIGRRAAFPFSVSPTGPWHEPSPLQKKVERSLSPPLPKSLIFLLRCEGSVCGCFYTPNHSKSQSWTSNSLYSCLRGCCSVRNQIPPASRPSTDMPQPTLSVSSLLRPPSTSSTTAPQRLSMRSSRFSAVTPSRSCASWQRLRPGSLLPSIGRSCLRTRRALSATSCSSSH
jgi:hypothetical protein